MTSFPNVKNNHLRGDFYFRDVFQRNTYASFKGPSYCDNATLYINQDDEAINCTSQVSTYDNGVGSLHVFTRNNADFNKANTNSATVSLNFSNTTFRSSQTNVQGGFTVGAGVLSVRNGKVGVLTGNAQFALDITGNCNVDVQGAYRINGVPILSQTVAGTTVNAASLTTTSGNVGTLSVQNLEVTGNFVGTSVTSVTWSRMRQRPHSCTRVPVLRRTLVCRFIRRLPPNHSWSPVVVITMCLHLPPRGRT